ncbi:hypothetical protein KCU85_g154, partial [Aureobasidium melanogenum]
MVVVPEETLAVEESQPWWLGAALRSLLSCIHTVKATSQPMPSTCQLPDRGFQELICRKITCFFGIETNTPDSITRTRLHELSLATSFFDNLFFYLVPRPIIPIGNATTKRFLIFGIWSRKYRCSCSVVMTEDCFLMHHVLLRAVSPQAQIDSPGTWHGQCTNAPSSIEHFLTRFIVTEVFGEHRHAEALRVAALIYLSRVLGTSTSSWFFRAIKGFQRVVLPILFRGTVGCQYLEQLLGREGNMLLTGGSVRGAIPEACP